ncbi:hypothetical protein BSKO_11596 [Bryopsis sp. KO-2023]|nr:hypothetical protein BSKO_11596 [Bryopsis sp. KO-2023]
MAQRGERKWTFGQSPPRQPQRDPQVSYPSHYSQTPNRPRPSDKSVFEKDLKDERPLWVLSVYGEPSKARLFGHDTSFEEVRLHEMSLKAAGCPVEQIAAETDGYRHQAMRVIEGFLDHRRRIEGGPQQTMSPRGKWSFGATPGGRSPARGHHFPQGNQTNQYYNSQRGGGIPYGSPGRSTHHPPPPPRQDFQRVPYASPRGSTQQAQSRPPQFKSALFGASPSAAEAFSNSQKPSGAGVGNSGVGISIQASTENKQDSGNVQNAGDGAMQTGEEGNPWLAVEFKDKIPEEPPPEEYIKAV